MLAAAIDLTREARAAGNHPFGALLAIDGAAVLTARNTVFTDRDPTAHAETNLVAAAIRKLAGGDFLVECRTLFSRATEPVEVSGPWLLPQARAVHEGYWTEVRPW